MGRDAKKYDVFSRFTREDHTYGASRLPKTTVLQSCMYVCMYVRCKRNTGHGPVTGELTSQLRNSWIH